MYELRQILDWSCTPTTLKLFDWLKLEVRPGPRPQTLNPKILRPPASICRFIPDAEERRALSLFERAASARAAL